MFTRIPQHDFEYLYNLLMYLSITIFVLCVTVLVSGSCISDSELDRRQLHYISTELGACLKENAYVSWGFVVALQMQMLLLLYTFLHLIYSHQCDVFLCGFRQDTVALSSGSLVILFVCSMASVVEFRNHSPSHVERFYHGFSAVCAISIFFVIHSLMCYCTRLCRIGTTEYSLCKNYYLALTVSFFVLWVAHSAFSTLSLFAQLTEWVLLFMGVFLHGYAIFVMQDNDTTYQTSKKSHKSENDIGEEQVAVRNIVIWMTLGAITSVTFVIFSTSYVDAKDAVYLQTGAEFWTILMTTYLAVSSLLIFARLNLRHMSY